MGAALSGFPEKPPSGPVQCPDSQRTAVGDLAQINEQLQDRLDRTTAQMAATESVTENLKAADPMAWAGAMNNIRSRAEELILREFQSLTELLLFQSSF